MYLCMGFEYSSWSSPDFRVGFELLLYFIGFLSSEYGNVLSAYDSPKVGILSSDGASHQSTAATNWLVGQKK